ncbi:MAG: toll/interleukin-1 receptor domain-containing protein, partial [Ktedonobacterales bacterium]
MASIFVSYRRDDSGDIADRITSHLSWRYGERQVFRDVNAIYVGSDWVRVLKHAIEDCQAMLVVIGPGWLDARNAEGQRRLDNPNDFVRIEIATALRQGTLVVPLLVHGAHMPAAATLPPDLVALPQRQGFPLRDPPAFFQDVQTIVAQINTKLSWRPASWGLFATALSFAVIFLLTTLDASIARDRVVTTFLLGISTVAFFGTLLYALVLAGQRRHWWWFAALLATLALQVLVQFVPVLGFGFVVGLAMA